MLESIGKSDSEVKCGIQNKSAPKVAESVSQAAAKNAKSLLVPKEKFQMVKHFYGAVIISILPCVRDRIILSQWVRNTAR